MQLAAAACCCRMPDAAALPLVDALFGSALVVIYSLVAVWVQPFVHCN
jgi:hypothetical protein